jgi:hypothetical protein
MNHHHVPGMFMNITTTASITSNENMNGTAENSMSNMDHNSMDMDESEMTVKLLLNVL